jgi:hypothetical protein
LGEISDCDATRALLSDRNVFQGEAVEALVKRFSRKAKRYQSEFRRFWKETFDRPGQERRWLGYFGRPAPRKS